jgi:NhaP-type Na+/H+ or K+/H+ antiporter
MAMKTAIGLDHSRYSFQQGRGLSSQELRLLIVQREVAYERLAAKLERARDDLQQLRMQQSHQLLGSAVLDEAQPDEKPKGTDKSEEDSNSDDKSDGTSKENKKNVDQSEEASDSDGKSDGTSKENKKNDNSDDAGNSDGESGSTSNENSVIVPVPYFMHDKKHPGFFSKMRRNITTPWAILGDALEPVDEEHATHAAQKHGGNEYDDSTSIGQAALAKRNQEHGVSDGGHTHGYVALLFFFSALVIGSLLEMLLRRYAPAIPYTCGLFLIGCFLSCIHYVNRSDHPLHWDSWYASIEMWQGLDPHLLFYTFLPALLFGDVMKLKVQLVAVCSKQIFLLACPGVFFGTLLTALFGRYVLPYHWDWPICFLFGSIMAATDPVAVVSLFNTLGVSPKLTMLVSGESLLNDGTAIVLFALALKVVLGAPLHLWEAVFFFLQMTVVAAFVGFIVGLLCISVISYCSGTQYHTNTMIQVVMTICCGYLAFFISESEFESSGVLATVSAGLVLAHSAWPLFVSRETVEVVWEAIEFIGNTIIFFLAGLIFMGMVLHSKSVLGLDDLFWLFILYFAVIGIRAVMITVLWIPLNLVGSPIYWQEGAVMVWSGLRGAVSVAMGMIVSIEPDIDHVISSRVMFHVGGIAALTLIVNSMTTPYLLRSLGLIKSDALMNRIGFKLSSRITERMKETFEDKLHNPNDARYYGANPTMVWSMVPMLGDGHAPGTAESLRTSQRSAQPNLEWKLVQVYREVFLRVVQSRYWQGVEDEIVPRHLLVYRSLVHSTEEALDNTWETLSDWDILASILHIYKRTVLQRLLGSLASMWPFKFIPVFNRAAPDFQQQLKIYVALSFIEAHTFAQVEVPRNIGTDDAVDIRVQKQVLHESNLQKQKAIDLIESMPMWLVERCKSEMLARKLLRQRLGMVEHMKTGGFLTKAEATHIEEPCHHALADISKFDQNTWQDRFYKQSTFRTRDELKDVPPTQPHHHQSDIHYIHHVPSVPSSEIHLDPNLHYQTVPPGAMRANVRLSHLSPRSGTNLIPQRHDDVLPQVRHQDLGGPILPSAQHHQSNSPGRAAARHPISHSDAVDDVVDGAPLVDDISDIVDASMPLPTHR